MKTETWKKRVLRVVISLLFATVFTVSLVLLGLVPSFRFATTADGAAAVLEEIQYVEKMKEKILEKFEFLSQTSGVPETLYRDFLEEELSSEVALSPLLGVFSPEGGSFDRAAFVEIFCQKVEAHAISMQESGELKLSEEEWEEMKNDFPGLAQYYVGEISNAVNMRGIYADLQPIIRFAQKLFVPCLVTVVIFAAFSLILILLIQKKNSLFYGYLSFVAAGLILAAPAYWLKAGDFVGRLGVEPQYLKEFIVAYSNRMIEPLWVMGLAYLSIGLVSGIAAFVLFLLQKNKKSEKKENDPQISEQNAEH